MRKKYKTEEFLETYCCWYTNTSLFSFGVDQVICRQYEIYFRKQIRYYELSDVI